VAAFFWVGIAQLEGAELGCQTKINRVSAVKQLIGIVGRLDGLAPEAIP
jgi:hypothetical protein